VCPPIQQYGTKLVDSVRDDFEGSTPPPVVFQWGIAEGDHSTDDGAAYDRIGGFYRMARRSASDERPGDRRDPRGAS